MTNFRINIIATLGATILGLLVLPAAEANGQTRLEGQFIAAGSRGLGYEGIALGAGVRSLSRFGPTGRIGLDARLSVLNSPKRQTAQGTLIQGHLLSRFYLTPTVYAGGGIWFGKGKTNLYSKLDGAVVGMVGWQRGLVGFEGGYEHGLNENAQRLVRFGGDVPVIHRSGCYADRRGGCA